MLQRVLFLLVLVLTGFLATAQSIFEFDYHFDVDKHREHYSALLFRNDDGTGFIRVRFKDDDTKQWLVIDMHMQEHYYGDENENDKNKTDSTVLLFEGYDPVVVMGDPKYEYDPDIFVFEYNNQTGFYEPHAVWSVDDKNKVHEGAVTKMELLEEKDLTEQKVGLFFKKDEDFFVNMFEEATPRSLTSQEKNTKLYLLLVANTEDISIGTTCVVDKDATYKTFSQVAEFLGIQFNPVVIDGKTFGKANVDNAINRLNPSPNDIVIFYYSGHGFNDAKAANKFPFLDLRDKTFQMFGDPYTLNIEDVFKRIKSKGARLNLVISDCCNSDPSQSSLLTPDGATTRSSSIGWNMLNCRYLFMNPKPQSILMTAASKGELSAGNSTGGIFTFNFRESLEKLIGPFYNNSDWNTILQTAQKQTVTKAKKTWCKQEDNSRKVCVQNPVFRIEQ